VWGRLFEFLDDCFDLRTDKEVWFPHLEIEFGQSMVFEGPKVDFVEGDR
jgi:hypothetical protein